MLTDTTNSYGVIYTITNLVNHKVYVGQTKTPKLRYRQHLQERSNRPVASQRLFLQEVLTIPPK